ncbi:MAG: T9SS type A sorting domain-containing protein [Bacteroidetes bacterium]|nr:T9SS type A sorting domain-containing protein [Bacteroidota bacterium]
MIKIIILFFTFLLLYTVSFAQNAVRLTVLPPTTNIRTTIDGATIQGLIPGDTILFEHGTYYQIVIKNISGTVTKPIVILNKSGQVIIANNPDFGLKVGGCSYLKLSGKGYNSYYYGWLIKDIITTGTSGGNGLSMDDLSTNIEVENIEIKNVSYVGIFAKTDPSCAFLEQLKTFSMNNILIHDCYLHKIGHEGMYLGSSKYKDGYSVTCNNITSTVYPHLLKNLRVYNNIVDSTGWDAVQISCVDSCKVYNNRISHDSQDDSANQMSGILFGGGSKNCNCYNNRIVDGHGDGIEVLGLGNIKVFNNLIVNAGKDYTLTGSKHGIYVGSVTNQDIGATLILNNTIITPRTYGINFQNNISIGSKAINNIIVVPSPYLNAIVNNLNLENSYNLTKATITEPNLFTDPLKGDYSLSFFSEAKDNGIDLSSYGVTFDILGNPRPYPKGGFFDRGAFEYTPGVGIDDHSSQIEGFNLFPNPNNGDFTIKFNLKTPDYITLYIYNITGKCLYKSTEKFYSLTENAIDLHLSSLLSGFYLIKLIGKQTLINHQFIISK